MDQWVFQLRTNSHYVFFCILTALSFSLLPLLKPLFASINAEKRSTPNAHTETPRFLKSFDTHKLTHKTCARKTCTHALLRICGISSPFLSLYLFHSLPCFHIGTQLSLAHQWTLSLFQTGVDLVLICSSEGLDFIKSILINSLPCIPGINFNTSLYSNHIQLDIILLSAPDDKMRVQLKEIIKIQDAPLLTKPQRSPMPVLKWKTLQIQQEWGNSETSLGFFMPYSHFFHPL